MKDKTILGAVAIGAITVLEGIALYKGIDGTVLSTVVAVIAGLAGYTVGRASTP